ncbi:MAG TPA: plastocyanin/azurin family copper-binding protein [Thermoanaerobaculia bacterium]|nr:plastocyanin/azurin family copper-binding protein [Thermoanaerobaculia bacterium]
MTRLQGLALAVGSILLVSCGGGGGKSPTEPAPTPQTVVVQVFDNYFSPKSIVVQPGDTVHWVRVGANPAHTVTANDGAFNSGANGLAPAGSTFDHMFNDAGATHTYYCLVHGACCMMQGSVRVGNAAPPPPAGY